MPPQFNDDTVIRRARTALSREFQQEVAVILPAATAVRVLNEVGGRIWQLADGRTFGEIVDTLLNEFEVERTQLSLDVRSFLSELQDRGLLEGPSEK